MSTDATPSPRLPLTIGALIALLGDITDPDHVSICVRYTFDGEPSYTYPVDAFLTIHRTGLVELTIDLTDEVRL